MTTKAGEEWTTDQKFILLRYSLENAEDLAKIIGRSEVAIKTKARRLNMGKCYMRDHEGVTVNSFCCDCTKDPKECGKDVKDCLREAKLYRKFYTIK